MSEESDTPSDLSWPEKAPAAGSVSLRRFSYHDVPMAIELSADPYVPITGTLPARASVADARAWIDRQLGRVKEGRGFSFAIAVDDGPLAVGQVGLWLTELNYGRASVGYAIAPSARGRGTASRALKLAVKFAWTIPHVHRIEAVIEPWNAASVHTAETAGFAREGLLRSYREIGGTRRDMYMYSIIRRDQPHR